MTTEETILNEEEWESFQPVQGLSPEISGKLWNGIARNTSTPRARYRWFGWAAVAAVVLLAIGLPWRFISAKQKPGIISAPTSAPVVTAEPIVNNNLPQKTLTLSDGSTVELLANSTLSCPPNYNALKRDVILNGDATFTIAKDAARPFSVYSHSVLITVLGTRFTVKSYEAGSVTKVILQEGRIMVKICNPASRDNNKEYYLAPGDVFVFKMVDTPSHLINANPVVVAPQRISPDSLAPRILHLEKDKDGYYAFDNFPLDVVFDQLQIIYNTKIVYNKAALGNRSFIGKIDKKDSLFRILKSIALLNNFDLHQQGDSFIIGK